MKRGAALVVAVASGILLAFAFPEPDLAPLAWVSLAPLLWLIQGAGARRGAVLAMAFGWGFFAVLLYWISIVGVLAWVALVLKQSLFLALFGGIVGAATARWPGHAARLAIPAVVWVTVEYLRSVFPVVGFTWGQLAQSQHNVPVLLKGAGIAGGWGTALLLVIVNAGLAGGVVSLFAGERRRAALLGATAVVALVLPAAVPSPSADGETVEVAIVQGNVPIDMPVSYEKERTILASHVHLTSELPDTVDLVVWPESSVGIDPARDEEVMAEISAAARSAGAPMLIGGNQDLPHDRYKVLAYLVSAEGEIVDSYQKTHLVPFGEYVPARGLLGGIPALAQVPRDAVAGSEGKVFDVAGGRVAPVISFEGDFGSLVRARIAQGGRLLVVATNTSTWNYSWASAQHLALSQVRAAENGVPVAHAALSGISAFIRPTGEVIERTELWNASVLTQELRFATRISFYARTGDWLPLLCLAATLAGLLGLIRKRSPDVQGSR